MKGYRRNRRAIVPKVLVVQRKPRKEKDAERKRPLRDAVLQGLFATETPKVTEVPE